MKRIGLGICALVAIGALVASAVAVARSGGSGGLDRSYGVDGMAAVAQPPGDHLGGWRVEEFASARDGSVYAMGRGWANNCYTCAPTYVLLRIDSNGGFDPGFGGDTGVVLPAVPSGYGLSVDWQGRPLVTSHDSGAVTVRRYQQNGQADPGFGAGGTASVACRCDGAAVRVAPMPHEKILVEADRAASGEQYSPGPGAEVALTRLQPSGTPDPSFGAGGSVGFPLPHLVRPTLLAVAGKGSILLGGSSPRLQTLVYAVRVSAKGRLDTRFNRTVLGSMRRLRQLGEFADLSSLIARGDGTIELLGPSKAETSFELRLRANGKLARNFGKGGLNVLPFTVSSAALGSGGAIFAVGGGEERWSIAYRILKSGRIDPRFGGKKGIRAPFAGTGILVGTQEGRRAVVMNRGEAFCRSACAPTPAVARYIEPKPIRRHHR